MANYSSIVVVIRTRVGSGSFESSQRESLTETLFTGGFQWRRLRTNGKQAGSLLKSFHSAKYINFVLVIYFFVSNIRVINVNARNLWSPSGSRLVIVRYDVL